MGRIGIIREARRAGVVTERYPYKPSVPPEGFRGAPKIDTEKCVGCGTCSRECPSNAIRVYDEDGYRIVSIFYGRCIYCYRCRDVCPEGAIIATREFELTTDNIEDLYYIVKLRRARCIVCGRYIDTERRIKKTIERLKQKGVKVTDALIKSFYTCPVCKKKTAKGGVKK